MAGVPLATGAVSSSGCGLPSRCRRGSSARRSSSAGAARYHSPTRASAPTANGRRIRSGASRSTTRRMERALQPAPGPSPCGSRRPHAGLIERSEPPRGTCPSIRGLDGPRSTSTISTRSEPSRGVRFIAERRLTPNTSSALAVGKRGRACASARGGGTSANRTVPEEPAGSPVSDRSPSSRSSVRSPQQQPQVPPGLMTTA